MDSHHNPPPTELAVQFTATTATAALAIIQPEKLELLKATIMPGASDVELDFFVEVCNRTKLDPFRNEIHPVKRRVNHNGQWVERWTFQTGIDGYRKRAAGTGLYAGSEVATEPMVGKNPDIAVATVYRLVGGQRVPFTARARWREYCQTGRDGAPIAMWARMPFRMLEKCAEALALRMAFPDELNGVYAEEEMMADPERKIVDREAIEAEIAYEVPGKSIEQKEPEPVEVVTETPHEDSERDALIRKIAGMIADSGIDDSALNEALTAAFAKGKKPKVVEDWTVDLTDAELVRLSTRDGFDSMAAMARKAEQ